MSSSLIEHFSKVKDPRMLKKCDHLLIDVLVIAVCASLCRFDESWKSIEDFGHLRVDWLRKFLALPNGIPSQDTFRRVFLILDPIEFQKCFQSWVNDFRESIDGETIAIDGKALRGSRDDALGKKAIYMVSAWANENQMVLGQVKVDEKSNEITAIPKLLEILDIAGCTVTIDAIGAQKKIAEEIIENNADYILGLKGNQGLLHDDITTYIKDQLDNKITDISHQSIETVDADHGRIEERKFHLFSNIDWLEQRPDWKGFESIGVVESTREIKGKQSFERRFFITSLKDIKKFAKSARGHWGIENSLHWSLDVSFSEDTSTRRKGNSPANSTVIKHITLNLLKKEKTLKRSINTKRSHACMNLKYLEKVVFG